MVRHLLQPLPQSFQLGAVTIWWFWQLAQHLPQLALVTVGSAPATTVATVITIGCNYDLVVLAAGPVPAAACLGDGWFGACHNRCHSHYNWVQLQSGSLGSWPGTCRSLPRDGLFGTCHNRYLSFRSRMQQQCTRESSWAVSVTLVFSIAFI